MASYQAVRDRGACYMGPTCDVILRLRYRKYFQYGGYTRCNIACEVYLYLLLSAKL